MERIIIFGSNGMLGRYVSKVLEQDGFSVVRVTRQDVDVSNTLAVAEWCHKNLHSNNDVIVNCAGAIPQRCNEREEMVLVNTMFPLWLDKLEQRVIHISSDCVFEGYKWERYTEVDRPTSTTDYGMTKYLGEPKSKTVIRTSIIGEKGGLLQWLLDKTPYDTVSGYTNHYWNGVTCLTLARIISRIIKENLFWNGIKHIYSPDVCTKYILLQYINEEYDLSLNILPKLDNPTYRILSHWWEDGIEWNIPSIPQQIKEQRDYENYWTT